jgi:hypothetical protein
VEQKVIRGNKGGGQEDDDMDRGNNVGGDGDGMGMGDGVKETSEVTPFWELLSVLGDEELIRIGYRLRKGGKVETAEMVAEELEGRELMRKDRG